MTTVVARLGELRNRGYRTSHGPAGARVGLRARYDHLAVNTAVTWCQLLLDTLTDWIAPWHQNPPAPTACQAAEPDAAANRRPLVSWEGSAGGSSPLLRGLVVSLAVAQRGICLRS